MSTELFATDAYLRSFDAAVDEVDRNGGRVALARTAFYPGGGGQPHDLGTLRTDAGLLPVARVKREQGRIWHWLSGGSLPSLRSCFVRRTSSQSRACSPIACRTVWSPYRLQLPGACPRRQHSRDL